MFNKKLKEEIKSLKIDNKLLKQKDKINVEKIAKIEAFYYLYDDRHEIPEEDINKQLNKYRISDNYNTTIEAERMSFCDGIIKFENTKRCVEKVLEFPYKNIRFIKRDIWYLVASCSANLTVTKI